MTIHQQLTDIVLPDLENFKDDLLVHDLSILQDYTGPFLYGYRRSGTDLLKLLPTFESYKARFFNKDLSDLEMEAITRDEIIWITYKPERNTKFLYYDGFVFLTIDRET